jgi:Leucine-rich repeat (LRR) protein
MRQFRDLRGLQRFNLERLSLQDLYSHHHAALGTLTNLQCLELVDCLWVHSLDWIAPLTKLSSLSLSGCANLRSVKPLRDMPQLQKLNLDGCTLLSFHDRTSHYLSSLWRLEEFSANEWFGDKGLRTLMKCLHLKRVTLQNCHLGPEARRLFSMWCRKHRVIFTCSVVTYKNKPRLF